jgi:arginase
MALEYIGGQTPIHLSCDIDALDPEWASSAGHLVPGGLSLQEGKSIVRRVHKTGNLVAMDLLEVNSTINVDRVERTINSACALGFST